MRFCLFDDYLISFFLLNILKIRKFFLLMLVWFKNFSYLCGIIVKQMKYGYKRKEVQRLESG